MIVPSGRWLALACSFLLLPASSEPAGADGSNVSSDVFPGKDWAKGEPADAGLDKPRLEAFSQFVGGRGCVVRHGYLVYSWGDITRRADIASACKPFYAHFLMKGVEQGRIQDVDERVVRFEPRLARINQRLGFPDRKIRWRDLANQTSCYGLVETPGTAFAYNDWQTALFWDTLFLKVFRTTRDQVDEQVFRPLLTDLIECQDSPTMVAFGTDDRPGRVGISVRDFARFGLLYLHQGNWRGRQLLTRQHAMQVVGSALPNSIPQAGHVAAEMIPGQRSIGSREVPDNQTDHFGSYSWMWWINGVDRHGVRMFPDAPHDLFGAFGHGGRRAMWVIPSLDIVVSYNDAQMDRWTSGANNPTNRAIKLLVEAAVAPAERTSDDASGRTRAVDFVRDVRPILARHCYECHGEKRQKSGLRLDHRAGALEGGDGYGASIIPGSSAESPLFQFVALEDADLQMPPERDRLSASEIVTLRRWIDQGAHWPESADTVTLDDPGDHWSFQKLVRPGLPQVSDAAWARGAVDRFVLARLDQVGLQPAGEATRREWIRRAYLDLIGLPPTPTQIDRFLADPADDAYQVVVDELLASPRYGERWTQHWLDVVRYADTHGFEVNTERPHAWPYRDYVIRAVNADVPFNQFVTAQIAGDAIGQDAATGFLVTASVLLPGQIGKDAPSIRLARQDALDEIVTNIGQTFLGLSVGCARCHDHKFDPISQREYYAMQAFVAGVEYGDREIPASDGTTCKVFAGRFREPDAIHLLRRGDPEQPRELVAPEALSILGELKLSNESTEQQRRIALANWITQPSNPLTARVIVNRVWQSHFGRGIVETPNDFGHSGQPPSHPQLLDWLASEFVESGWSIKHLHRLIVLSATYRQSSHVANQSAERLGQRIDADVRWLWRYPARRVDAETIRDSMLSVSGELNLKMYGRGYDLFDKRGGLSGFVPVDHFRGDGLRRMIYAHKVRRERDAIFGAFDCPDGGQSTPRRRESTTPVQALNLFNSPFTIERAEAFAARVAAECGDDQTAQIHRAYRLALGRRALSGELTDARPVVASYGLATLCRVLMNSNEFVFLP